MSAVEAQGLWTKDSFSLRRLVRAQKKGGQDNVIFSFSEIIYQFSTKIQNTKLFINRHWENLMNMYSIMRQIYKCRLIFRQPDFI